MSLAHYIIVRRDLPLGVLAAMICHAAGESGHLYEAEEDGRFRGATAIVLEAKDENELDKAEDYLDYWSIQAVSIRESEGPYAGQLMAIGLVPVERDTVSKLMERFQALKAIVKPEDENLDKDLWGV